MTGQERQGQLQALQLLDSVKEIISDYQSNVNLQRSIYIILLRECKYGDLGRKKRDVITKDLSPPNQFVAESRPALRPSHKSATGV